MEAEREHGQGNVAARRLALDDLYRMKVPSDPQLSPDGRRVAYVVTVPDRDEDSYRTSIWVAEADGSATTQLTSGPKDSSPRWSPDGTRLAFLSGRGSDAAQLHILPMTGGDPTPLTTLPLGAGAAVWAPNGSHIAFTAPVDLDGPAADDQDRARRAAAPVVVDRLDYKADGGGLIRTLRSHLFVVPADGGSAAQLTWGDWSVSGPVWAPDGTSLAFASSKGPDRDLAPITSIFSVPFACPAGVGTPRRLSDGSTPLTNPLFTADGSRLLCAGSADLTAGHTRLFTMDVGEDGLASDLTPVAPAFDRNVMLGAPGYPGGNPTLVENDTTVVFCARDRGCTHVFSVELDGGADGADGRAGGADRAGRQPRPVVAGPDRTISGISISASAGLVAYVASDPSSPGEVFVASLDGADERQLTHLAADSIGDVELLRPEERTFTAPDGTPVHGWVLRDPSLTGGDRAPAPLLLDIHGGPHNAWSPVFDGYHSYHQTLAADGWVVLFINPRGSDGYGEAFYQAVVNGWGTSDNGDFHAAIDALIDEGLADPSRLAVTGYSYGGFMTCWLTSTSGRFAAAVPGGCVSNLASEFGTADVGLYLGLYEVGGTPADDADIFRRMSPITRVGEVTTPTLLLHGEADQRCPVSQAEEWFAALRSRRVPCELVRYPGASHLFIISGRPSHRRDYAQRVVDWVQTHAGGKEGRSSLRRRLAGYQARFDDLARRHHVPGAQVAVLLGDEIVDFATGVLRVDAPQAVTTTSRFQIGSITKLFTATLLMQLVDRGLVDLDAPVATYLPEFRLADAGASSTITVRHLLNHTNAIPGDHFQDTGPGDDCIERYVAGLAAMEMVHPVGTMFSYSNGGYVVAGRVIEAVSGKTYARALQDSIVDPLGLSLRTSLEDIVTGTFAFGHVVDPSSGDTIVAPIYAMGRSMTPAGSTPAATARDLVVFARMHLDEGADILSPSSVKAMQERQMSVPGHPDRDNGVGLGWGLATWDGERVIGHAGGTIGQLSNLSVLPDRRIAVAIVANGPTGMALGRDVWIDLFGELAGVEPPAPPTAPRQPVELDLEPYQGTYRAQGMTTTITIQDGALALGVVTDLGLGVDLPDPPAVRLVPVDAFTFVTADGTTISFLEWDANGRPAYLFAGRLARRTT